MPPLPWVNASREPPTPTTRSSIPSAFRSPAQQRARTLWCWETRTTYQYRNWPSAAWEPRALRRRSSSREGLSLFDRIDQSPTGPRRTPRPRLRRRSITVQITLNPETVSERECQLIPKRRRRKPDQPTQPFIGAVVTTTCPTPPVNTSAKPSPLKSPPDPYSAKNTR